MRHRSFVLVAATIAWLGGAALASAQAAAPWSAADCQTCHPRAAAASFTHTKHASLGDSCASCHVNVAEHVKAKMDGGPGAVAPSPALTDRTAREITSTCLTCHEKGKQASYLSGMHARQGVACTSCHS